MKNNLTQLYDLANINYEGTYSRIARDTILRIASDYPASTYWNNRSLIADRMKVELDTQLQKVFGK
jgi:hypothetical protein